MIVIEPVHDVLARLDTVRESLPVPALVDFYVRDQAALYRTLEEHTAQRGLCLCCQTRYPCQYAEWATAIHDALPRR